MNIKSDLIIKKYPTLIRYIYGQLLKRFIETPCISTFGSNTKSTFLHTFTGHPPRNSWKFRHKIENRNKKCIRNPRVLLSLFFIKRIRNIFVRFGVLLCSILSSHSIIYAHLKKAKILMKQGINIILLIALIKTLYRISQVLDISYNH